MEDSNERNSLLTDTVSSLIHVIFKLENREQLGSMNSESADIKKFLIHSTDWQDVDLYLEERLLILLEKNDPDFVKEWKAKKATTNTENEESS